MAAGNVKWFNNAKGYGFILPESGGEDLFAHYSSIHMDGYKTLKAGQEVEFDIIEGPKGLHAVNIRAPSSVSADFQPPDVEEATAQEEEITAPTTEATPEPETASTVETTSETSTEATS